MYFEPVLLYTCPLIIAISSWWVDLETDTFLRDPTTPAAPKFCLREKSSCRENSERKEWEKKMTEIPSTVFRDRRLYSRCSLRVLMPVPPRPSPLDNYKWDCLWDSAKIKKKKKKKKKCYVLYILAQRDFLSQAAGQTGKVSLRILALHAPLCSFAMRLSGLKSR